MSYELVLREHPSYLHAEARGTRSPENAQRFLEEAYAACVAGGRADLLLEINFDGPSLDPASIFRVILGRSDDAVKLRRIAYVDVTSKNPERMKFAETVAVNRGVNVRLFQDLADAQRWISALSSAV
jgi:hypothetical protein